MNDTEQGTGIKLIDSSRVALLGGENAGSCSNSAQNLEKSLGKRFAAENSPQDRGLAVFRDKRKERKQLKLEHPSPEVILQALKKSIEGMECPSSKPEPECPTSKIGSATNCCLFNWINQVKPELPLESKIPTSTGSLHNSSINAPAPKMLSEPALKQNFQLFRLPAKRPSKENSAWKENEDLELMKLVLKGVDWSKILELKSRPIQRMLKKRGAKQILLRVLHLGRQVGVENLGIDSVDLEALELNCQHSSICPEKAPRDSSIGSTRMSSHKEDVSYCNESEVSHAPKSFLTCESVIEKPSSVVECTIKPMIPVASGENNEGCEKSEKHPVFLSVAPETSSLMDILDIDSHSKCRKESDIEWNTEPLDLFEDT